MHACTMHMFGSATVELYDARRLRSPIHSSSQRSLRTAYLQLCAGGCTIAEARADRRRVPAPAARVQHASMTAASRSHDTRRPDRVVGSHTRDVSGFQDGQGARRIGQRSAPGSAPATRASRRRLRFRPRHAHAREKRGGRERGSGARRCRWNASESTLGPPLARLRSPPERRGPSSPSESPIACGEFGGPST